MANRHRRVRRLRYFSYFGGMVGNDIHDAGWRFISAHDGDVYRGS